MIIHNKWERIAFDVRFKKKTIHFFLSRAFLLCYVTFDCYKVFSMYRMDVW